MSSVRIRPAVALTVIGVALMALLAPPASADDTDHTPSVSVLATFGSGLGSGSTIGPDGALYVTDGNAGAVLRVDRRTGEVSTFASGLPPQVLGLGGAMDVAFIGRTAYVLVTAVGGDLLLPSGTQHFGDATVGIYRINRDGSSTVVADIGAWSAAHPPATSYVITTGVQYALQPYRHGFVVTDGHLNRVLHVRLDGSISEFATFDNIVPTGVEVANGKVYVAQAGPIPHDPKDARVVRISRSGVRTIGSGMGVDGPGLAVDVERGPGRALYALLQGVWDLPITAENEGAPASHDSGAIVRIDDSGAFVTVVDLLDQPTSMELVGHDAYVVTLDGTVLRINHLAGKPGLH
jgi:hypothetical protein